MNNLTVESLALMIDSVVIKPNTNNDEIIKICDECRKYGFKSVFVSSSSVKLCVEALKDTTVNVTAAISFPLGQTSIATKMFEVKEAISNGCDEIEYMINLIEVKNNNYSYIEEEMRSIVTLCRTHQVVVKVIFETCFLENKEIVKLCRIANDVVPDFISTSTGYGGDAPKEVVKLIRETAIPAIGIKAGASVSILSGISSLIEAGATRFGTRCGPAIIGGFMYHKKLR